MSPTYRAFQFLTGPTVAKVVHGLVGLLGTAGLAYGAKKLFDKAVDEKVKAKQDGGRLGPAGYQLLPQYLVNENTPSGPLQRRIAPPAGTKKESKELIKRNR